MKRKLKKNIKKLLVLIIIILLSTIVIDLICIFNGNRPIFAVKENVINSTNVKYKGLFFDTYNCTIYSSYQIKSKFSKFNCPLANKNAQKEDKKLEAKLTLVGDLLFEQPFYDAINNGDDKNDYFSLVKDYFENDDLSIGNMEVVIGNDKLTTSGTGYNFCAPSYIGDLISTIDFEVLGTANNHSYDRGNAGIHSSIDFFKNNSDIVTVGTYKDIDDRNNLRILDINGIRFGFLAYTYGTNQKPKDNDDDLIGYYKDPFTKQFTNEYKEKLKTEITNLKKESDVVIVLMHWGNEFTYTPNKEQKDMALFLNNLGVDIIVGSHSHNIQPIEIIGDVNKTLVYYSLGNFVSHDDDIARTPLGEEEFDNAYQVGMLSTLNVVFDNNEVIFENINAELIVNYFDINMRNFKLIPFDSYNEIYEKSHYRYSKGLTKDFINNIYNNVIDSVYQKSE